MKYNGFVKTLAIVLAVLCVVCLILSGISVCQNIDAGFYDLDPADRQEEYLYRHGTQYAEQKVEAYLFAQSGMRLDLWERVIGHGHLDAVISPGVDYRIVAVWPDGSVTEQDMRTAGKAYFYDQRIWVGMYAGYAEPVEEMTVPNQEAEPTVATEVPHMAGRVESWGVVTDDAGESTYRIFRYLDPVECTVELYYTQEEYERVPSEQNILSGLEMWMYENRYVTLAVCVISAVLLVLLMAYLAFAAGRKPETGTVRPGGLNRMPLDLYAAVDGTLGIWLVWLLIDVILEPAFDLTDFGTGTFYLLLGAGAGVCAGIGLICILYWCAFWAQIKAPGGYWWKNTVIGRILLWIWKGICLIFQHVLGKFAGVGRRAQTIPEWIRDCYNKLPLMWQWLLVALAGFVVLAFLGTLCGNGLGLFLYVCVAFFITVLIIHGARAFGTLRDAAKRMSRGELDTKLNPDTLEGCFRDFACDLNALSDACVIAAREQLKSERMKTELITNVSHDIKTPLTSIINYVDLLQKAETEEQRREYLAVLERQSLKLKKLIEDLMEMSKASSGNVAAEIGPTDVVESVNQALGEYADRFRAEGLTVLFRNAGERVIALCDGKLLWRVLSNVMSNVVKYAMPGTRVYLDLTQTEHRVQLTLKNISREELNIDAEALMERFVRGDESRNTEGNGLGLNIAKSLMEVQNGSLDLVVDGDLFKVVLTLPIGEDDEG